MTEPTPGQLDPGIAVAVRILQQNGIETYESCEGGPGHSYPEPTICFHGGPGEGWRALAVCLTHALPVSELRRTWVILDRNEPTGPKWEIVFSRKLPAPEKGIISLTAHDTKRILAALGARGEISEPQIDGRIMSQWEIRGLETNFEGFKRDRYPSLATSSAFERFAIRQVLKDEDLSSDEIEYGILGGGDDGGVDGMYFFVNRALVQDEADLPEEALSAHLVIVQAKYENGFSETTITKLESFAHDLLDHDRNVDEMVHLNVDARDAIRKFRENYTHILPSQHTMEVTFAYVSKSDQDPNQKVLYRANALKEYVRGQLSYAIIRCDFWDCRKLLASARRSPNTKEALEISKQFTTEDKSAVCLVKLGSLAALLRNEHGEIRRSMLEPNVRDYQGTKNAVNKAIKETLAATNQPEFWWLNNGVTILAEDCSVAGNKLLVQRPEVVNGLQTSYEIFQYFQSHPGKDDPRTVLVRVIVPPDEQVRTKIIRATNSQTPISDLSLHATDPIHFDIEEKLRLYHLFYERRKGEYRELRKPVDQIISMQTLARPVIAILLHQPNSAYATPSRVLKSSYDQIFNDTYNRDMYVVCILLQRQVDKYLLSKGAELRDNRSIIRYYISMTIACELLKKTTPPTDRELASLLSAVQKQLSEKVFEDATELVIKAYKHEGETETIAKGPDMRNTILKWVSATLSVQGTPI